MTDYSARYGLISIYAHSQEGILLGEASISLVANPTEAISRNKIAILKDRRRVGEVFYSLTRPMEVYLVYFLFPTCSPFHPFLDHAGIFG